MKRRLLPAAALIGALMWPATLAWRALSRGYILADDLNGDHRPDRWRVYDATGQLIRIALDTNFDGIADVEQRYRQGVFVERDIDRNFDGRADQVDDLDPETGDRLRSVQDLDFDGAADRLVLLRSGEPVFQKRVSPATRQLQTGTTQGADEILPLDNPFSREHTLRTMTRERDTERLVAGSKLLVAVRARGDHRRPYEAPHVAWRPASSGCIAASPSRGPPRTVAD